ncbi:MAG: DAK2 domain-containing protein [Lachnospiraceae bacterium]|nr:DAK2 domain-containing protein [Lachnospiraceae bacterium]
MNSIDAKLLSKMFLGGAKCLEAKKEWINELNVFPVPDGDTGTNMTMTIMSAAKEVTALENTNDINMESLCKAISSGSLRGARGNSGVILSQLLRGLTKSVKTLEVITVNDFADAFEKAVETAYKAVMKPKEGTILTVAKGASDKARELANNGETDIETFIKEVIAYSEEVLAKTPDMLPVLKQAGVVDSGGQGLVEVFHGAYDAFLGKEIDLSSFSGGQAATPATSEMKVEEEIKFGYCTEFIIMLDKVFNVKHEMDFKAFLESIGDSIVLVADDEIVKVHVHTNDPGLAIQRALKYGALSNMKIDNMRLEHQEKLFKEAQKANEVKEEVKPEVPVELKDYGFISVSAGDGLSGIFKELGVDEIIEGGQTMNPSTEDMVNACNNVNAKTIFILPNNKNIIMAANQAQYLVEDKEVVVIPTKTIPQGITALINFNPEVDKETNTEIMTDSLSMVKTGQVTYAVRDTKIDDKDIKEGDFMGIGDRGLLSVDSDMAKATKDMVEELIMSDEPSELVTIYYGSDVSEETASEIVDFVNEKFPSVEADLQYGGQPIYYYIISAE